MTIEPIIAQTEASSRGVESMANERWFNRHEWQALGLSKPVRHLLETHLENSET